MDRATGIVPWHMWGEQQVIHLVSGAGEAGIQAAKQILRVSYGRPETWGFLLGLRVTDRKGTDFTGSSMTVNFDLTVGIGRAVLQIPDWHVFTATLPAIGAVLWTNTVANRVSFNGTNATFGTTSWLDTIVAQDIQLKARGTFGGGTTDYLDVAAHAYFAPRAHIRPEWWQGIFPGNEDRGT